MSRVLVVGPSRLEQVAATRSRSGRRRSSARRSRSVIPPQTPNSMRLSRASARHSVRTGQPTQTALARFCAAPWTNSASGSCPPGRRARRRPVRSSNPCAGRYGSETLWRDRPEWSDLEVARMDYGHYGPHGRHNPRPAGAGHLSRSLAADRPGAPQVRGPGASGSRTLLTMASRRRPRRVRGCGAVPARRRRQRGRRGPRRRPGAAPGGRRRASLAKTASQDFENLPERPASSRCCRSSPRSYAADGKLLATFYSQNRIRSSRSRRSARCCRRPSSPSRTAGFYEHNGVDLARPGRALVTNAQGRLGQQGGSTLTQQYVKNVLVLTATTDEDRASGHRQQTPARKLREMRLALGLEKRLDQGSRSSRAT